MAALLLLSLPYLTSIIGICVLRALYRINNTNAASVKGRRLVYSTVALKSPKTGEIKAGMHSQPLLRVSFWAHMRMREVRGLIIGQID